MKQLTLVLLALTAGCTVYVQPTQPEPPPQPVQYTPAPEPPPTMYEPAAPQTVVSVNIEFQVGQPEPIGCPWAPPPMLVEPPPPVPFEGGFWVGGFWAWQGTWVWVHGHWARPPYPGCYWHHPYYEYREGIVVFIPGFWLRPGVRFMPPPPHMGIHRVSPYPGVVHGPAPIGPQGVFVPPPPGSRPGIIIPAPIGTAPAVVTGAPPVISPGMRIQNSGNTTINNTTVVNNVTNVVIIAPASATASGKAVNTSVPAQAHLAAAMPAVIHTPAPAPISAKPLPAFQPGKPPTVLPPAQTIRPVVPPALQHPVPPPISSTSEPAPPPAAKVAPVTEIHPATTTTQPTGNATTATQPNAQPTIQTAHPVTANPAVMKTPAVKPVENKQVVRPVKTAPNAVPEKKVITPQGKTVTPGQPANAQPQQKKKVILPPPEGQAPGNP
jgi:hypothetical protein